MTRFTRATAAAGFVGLLLANGADSLYAQRARNLGPVTTAVNPAVLNNQPDLIAVAGGFRDLDHSEHFSLYVGHRQQMVLTLQNFTTNQGFSDLVATVRKIAGAGAYEVSWTIGAVPPPGTNLVIPPGSSTWGVPLAKPMWIPEPGDHKFEIIVDSANTLHEAAAYVGNNRREVTVTPIVPPEAYTQQQVNPSAVGPAGLLFALTENDPSNLCEATFEYATNAVRAKLRYLGSKPAPDGFIACEARADFYRYARIANDWEIASVSPSPPTGGLPAGPWYVRPEGKSLHTQVLLKIPAEAVFYPNSSGLAEMSLVITLRGLSGTQPVFTAIPPGLRIR